MYTHSLHKDPSLEQLYAACEKKALVRSGSLLYRQPKLSGFIREMYGEFYKRDVWGIL